MLINQESLNNAFDGFSTAYNVGFEGAKTHYRDVAMVVPSTAKDNTYGWLEQLPDLREWLGGRVIKNLIAHGYTVENRKFESTVAVPRTTMEDDQYGVLSPVFMEMGKSAAQHPDKLVFSLLAEGFTTLAYDGQYFFDTEHPVRVGDNDTVPVSNMQAGAGPAWFLIDGSRAIKPMLFQTRIPYTFTRLDREHDDNVFFNDQYIYGIRARASAGFGLWQLAFASKAPLTAANYEAARLAMAELKGDEGRPLGIVPDTLLAPPSLEGAAMRLLNNGDRIEIVTVGASDQAVSVTNEWAGTAKPIVTPWLAGAP